MMKEGVTAGLRRELDNVTNDDFGRTDLPERAEN